jgi:signal transduction histidine kinase
VGTPPTGPAVHDSEARQAFLLHLSDALRPLGDSGAIQRVASRVLREHLKAARVIYTDALDCGTLEVVAIDALAGLPVLIGRRFVLSDFGPRLEAEFSAGGTTWRDDVQADAGFSPAEKLEYSTIEVAAWATTSLVKDERVVGMVSAHFTAPHRWSREELALIEETAERTWAAVARARVEEALRRAHDELDARVRERTAQLAEANASLATEVAERRAAEAQIKALFERLVSAQEEERRRIARNIHDQLGQQITALRMNLERLKMHSREPVVSQAERTLALAEELDRTIDFLTWELRPATLDHLGLGAALRDLVDGWSDRFHVAGEYTLTGSPGRLPAHVEANLYRIVQEALHNVFKHARASRAHVLLEVSDTELVLAVSDDGQGFDVREVDRPRGDCLGLVSMRERATLAGGDLAVQSAAGQGTTVRVRVPVRGA